MPRALAARRAAYYRILTGAVLVVYAVLVFGVVLRAGAILGSSAFAILFTFALLLLFDPLRTRLQAFVDRIFSRTRYDGARVLATVGGELAATLARDRIVALVQSCVDQAIPNGGTRLIVRAGDGGLAGVSAPLAERLRGGEVVLGADGFAGAELLVPLVFRDQLSGVLAVGAKRSGLGYGADDVEFLRALANQAAIALANAATYEALVALNTRLEEGVRERTAQLQGANRELAEAYAELKTAEVQLVRSEKMASLGRLVAGVAHEINNPVSFIATSVGPLRRRLENASTDAPAEVARLLGEAREIVDVMARGAERTAAIVKDLRVFSRLGEATRKQVDLHDGLEVTIRLIEPRWRDRITIHRDYGRLPPVECDPAQLNQVFMNLLTNACDAIAGKGNVWIETRAGEHDVSVTVRDDGVGMTPEVLGRVFDPFFTTKDVGKGTGLGLAISHGVVAAHGGRIEAESAPGAGACFRVVLPVAASAVSLDTAASGGR
ncbi:MAG TPA: ATP-binding protein [Candidatus Binatia bacterium]|nr:ATP-binding protein [Candidatus Binatia bacterium]